MSNLVPVENASIIAELEALGLGPESITSQDLNVIKGSSASEKSSMFTQIDGGSLPVYYTKRLDLGTFNLYSDYGCEEGQLISLSRTYKAFRGVIMFIEMTSILNNGGFEDEGRAEVCRMAGTVSEDGMKVRSLPETPFDRMFGWDDTAKQFSSTIPAYHLNHSPQPFGVRADGRVMTCADCVKQGLATVPSISGKGDQRCDPLGTAWILVTELGRVKKDTKTGAEDIIFESVDTVKTINAEDEEVPLGEFILCLRLKSTHLGSHGTLEGTRTAGLARYAYQLKKENQNFRGHYRFHYTQASISTRENKRTKNALFCLTWEEVPSIVDGTPNEYWELVKKASSHWNAIRPESLVNPVPFEASKPRPLMTAGAIEVHSEDISEILDPVPEWAD